MHRHGRQTKLAEVGEAGQSRIVQSRIDVSADGLAGEVAVRYLAGAGVAFLRVPTEHLASLARAVDGSVEVEVSPALAQDEGAPVDASDLRDPAARAVGRGARLALSALRAALDGGR